MRVDNVLDQNMIEEEFTAFGKVEIKIGDLKEGDIVRLKDDKYGQIISSGEDCDDIDYGEMYKNIKRFKYINKDTYHLLYLEKERDKHEREIVKHKKEKYRLDLLIYLNKNSEVLSSDYDSNLYNEFRSSRQISRIDDVGTFYITSEGIKRMVTAGYNTLFYKVNIPEAMISSIKEDFDKINFATISTDVLDFTETLGR